MDYSHKNSDSHDCIMQWQRQYSHPKKQYSHNEGTHYNKHGTHGYYKEDIV